MRRSMLPVSPSAEVINGDILFGDEFNTSQLKDWFEIEAEGFSALETKSMSSKLDPWYKYNRYVNERHVWGLINKHFSGDKKLTLLVLGPGPGEELEKFIDSNSNHNLRLIEPSDVFRKMLAKKFPQAQIEGGNPLGINDTGVKYDAIVALQVLHHIANVSETIRQLSKLLNKHGLLVLREPCSSMGLWSDRSKVFSSATPNERGIAKCVINRVSIGSNLRTYSSRYPLAICLDPLNKFLYAMRLYGFMPMRLVYIVDLILSKFVSINDYYWRDKWWKRIGPSTYHYVYIKCSDN